MKIMSASLGYAFAFLAFFLATGRVIFKNLSGVLAQYRNAIISSFDEGEHLINEAKAQIHHAMQSQREMIQAHETALEIKKREVHRMAQALEKDMKDMEKSYSIMAQHQSQALVNKHNRALFDVLLTHIHQHILSQPNFVPCVKGILSTSLAAASKQSPFKTKVRV